ncbi:FUSC family protein [Thiotrichales bacterium 19S3-7]|nr:FUSC family protein [Thiotrichales bacterium 19S3-7]MCF6802373.1 FUSC family protein [Thiotrichales bacterium 19S3-11]
MIHLHQNRLSTKLFLSIEMALIVWVCFLISSFIGYTNHQLAIIGGLWAAISGVVVIQNTRKLTDHMAVVRLIGSFIGAAIAGIFLIFFPAHIILCIPVIFITSLICKFIHFEEGLRLANLTAAVVIAVSLLSPELPAFLNALSRFLESLIGVLVAVCIRWLVLYSISLINKYKTKK